MEMTLKLFGFPTYFYLQKEKTHFICGIYYFLSTGIRLSKITCSCLYATSSLVTGKLSFGDENQVTPVEINLAEQAFCLHIHEM